MEVKRMDCPAANKTPKASNLLKLETPKCQNGNASRDRNMPNHMHKVQFLKKSQEREDSDPDRTGGCRCCTVAGCCRGAASHWERSVRGQRRSTWSALSSFNTLTPFLGLQSSVKTLRHQHTPIHGP